MSRRAGASAFLVAALLAAVAAAAIADGYGEASSAATASCARCWSPATSCGRERRSTPRSPPRSSRCGGCPSASRRRARLAGAAEALGLAPAATVPAGSYLLAAQLRSPRSRRPAPGLGHGRRPVEIAVSGAGALAFGAQPVGSRVDVVVTTEPAAPSDGRTYVAAPAVPLLALGPRVEGGRGKRPRPSASPGRRRCG